MSSEYDEYSTSPQGSVTPPNRPPYTARALFVVTLACALVASSLLFALAGSGHITAQGQTGATTPSASPTPTQTLTPSAALGFQLYTDKADGFSIQYPDGWIPSPLNPGMQFADDSNETGYAAQVVLPGAATIVDPPQNVNDPAAWVAYELNFLESKYPQNFVRLTSADQSRVIGGATWQSGAGLITNSSSGIRIQVYATVSNGRPYIINLLAVSDRFSAGMIEYFSPMLNSYQFTPASA